MEDKTREAVEYIEDCLSTYKCVHDSTTQQDECMDDSIETIKQSITQRDERIRELEDYKHETIASNIGTLVQDRAGFKEQRDALVIQNAELRQKFKHHIDKLYKENTALRKRVGEKGEVK